VTTQLQLINIIIIIIIIIITIYHLHLFVLHKCEIVCELGKACRMLYKTSKVFGPRKLLVPPYYNQTGPILELLH